MEGIINLFVQLYRNFSQYFTGHKIIQNWNMGDELHTWTKIFYLKTKSLSKQKRKTRRPQHWIPSCAVLKRMECLFSYKSILVFACTWFIGHLRVVVVYIGICFCSWFKFFCSSIYCFPFVFLCIVDEQWSDSRALNFYFYFFVIFNTIRFICSIYFSYCWLYLCTACCTQYMLCLVAIVDSNPCATHLQKYISLFAIYVG